MRTYRFILTGLGNIGANFLDILLTNGDLLATRHGIALRAVGLADSSGALHDPGGFDLAAIVALKRGGGRLAALAGPGRPLLTTGELVATAGADFLLEATPTNLDDGQPGLDLVRASLARGLHTVLASKGPLVLAYAELRGLATRSALAFSGAVCGAMPTVNVGRRDLAGGRIRLIEAVFNGTTQVILARMAEGASYDAALAEAQRLGIAEPDPALDVDGWDAANKLVTVANAVLDRPTTLADVAVRGIRGVTGDEARAAAAAGGRLSLLATAEATDGAGGAGADYRLTVAPVALAPDHPLARLGLDEMGIVYHTDIYGRLAVTSAGQGPRGAAAAMLRDVIDIAGRGAAG